MAYFLYYTSVPFFRIFQCLFLYLPWNQGYEGEDDDPCHVYQYALALILAVFRRNCEEILHIMLYIGGLQTVFGYSRQICE